MLNIGIAGLGLIGGSIAKALAGKSGIESVRALSRNEDALRAALSQGVIQRGSADDFSVFSGCDAVFICVPVSRIYDYAKNVARHCGGVITDAGSTKGAIMRRFDGSGMRFIGGHPMAGSERSGYFASSAALFENAVYVFCPQRDTKQEDLKLLLDLASLMGAIPVVMDADEHDMATAAVSHVPHIEAGALCLLASGAGESAKRLAAGGFRDITRIASGSPQMWTDIVLNSSEPICAVLDKHIRALRGIRDAIIKKDADYINKFFTDAKDYRDSLPLRTKGAVPGHPQLLLEVPDKPGVLRDVTAILGDAGLNIKDLSIQNIREYEGGTLRITLQDSECAAKALSLLSAAGYDCKEA